MNLSNRIGVSLVALLGVVAAIVILLAVTEAVDSDFMPGGSGESAWFYSELQGLAGFGTTGQVVTIVVNVVVALALLLVLLTGGPGTEAQGGPAAHLGHGLRAPRGR